MPSETALGTTDLTGKMLIAMPGMGDPRFAHSLVFLCDHSDDGAMGLIVNKPSKDVDIKSLLLQLDIEMTPTLRDRFVHFGGPVEMGRGFVLHSPDYSSATTTLQVQDDISMTATLDVLEEIARGQGPVRWLMALGYAGWGAGQLESELAANGWLVCDSSAQLIFDLPDAQKWEAALETLGVAALTLSAEGGTA
ncbi:YqgE/AlgH family protein [Pacificoceanicola onchidii]|uniref:YqgE/AlgH family protein n=1 Tax=Pacificoceanicola onchidii TaxID=2562685 RepID=UPI0010A4EBE4|nr:YqgE/AlgH family protein [Pacificoceanicola onchidii]